MSLCVFVDTSAFYELTDPNERRHDDAVAILTKLEDQHAELLTTTFVLAESYGLAVLRFGSGKALAFLAGLRNSKTMKIISASDQDLFRAESILARYSDQDFSYVDAVSFAVIERLRIRRAFTFDKHFAVFRPSTAPLVLND